MLFTFFEYEYMRRRSGCAFTHSSSTLLMYCYLEFLLIVFSIYHETIQPMIAHVISVMSNRLVPIYAVSTEAKKLAISFDATWGLI